MKNLAISVIIPAFNEAKRLPACLRRLHFQLEPGDEIIVVDNNSTDNTADIAKSFGVRVVRESHQGISFARNKGIAEARNNYVARTDADTIVTEDWLKVIRDYYMGNKQNPITGPVYLREPWPLRLGVHSGIIKKKLGYQNALGGNVAFPRQVWEGVLPTLRNDDRMFSEDTELSIEWHRQGTEVIFVSDMIVYTSWRWMVRRPLRSWREWKEKTRNTFALTKE